MTSSLKRVRDSQRIRVYRANSLTLGKPLPSMDDVHNFANQVVASDLWRSMFKDEKLWHVPFLKPGKGARTAHVLWHDNGKIEIAFPKAYRYATYVLHELAHYGIGLNDSIAAHGPEFVGVWLTLVREFCNTKTVKSLERNLVKEKVKYFIPIVDHTTIEITEVKTEPKIWQLKLFA